ncbi:MAG: FIST N-terminal domain-containing protein [Planctomycetaceae bacterium]|nr:FIST C-terminal domain-containing protein [Planctomycetaceae bacterium]
MKILMQKSTLGETSQAVEEVLHGLESQLQGSTPELTFLFVTHHHEESFATLSGQIQNRLNSRHLIGCTTEAIVAEDKELEEQPGLVIWILADSHSILQPFHLQFQREADQIVCFGHPDKEDLAVEHGAVFLFCEPYSCSPQIALPQLLESQGLPIFGGVASGGIGPGENCLFLDGERIDHGAVGLVYRSTHKIRQIVSQGCRPIGHTFVVTKAEKNILYELGGLPAMQQFREMFRDLSPEDQERVRQGPHLGVVTNEYKGQFDRGDFLVSNVLGSDPETGAIAVSQGVRVGRTVQFHVRDAVTADEDLNLLIQQDKQHHSAEVRGGLVFTCNGRGQKLFGTPHHDISAIRAAYGQIPLAGFFAQGEIGPLGERSYLHGFTTSVALFEA